MKLICFGATGGIGRQVVAQALAAGHTVTAVARHPPALTIQHPQLTVVRGDVLAPTTVEQVMAGHDAVISTIGSRTNGPTTVCSAGVTNLLQAMHAAGVRRLLCISASGLDPGPLLQRWIAKPLLWYMFRESYTDLVRIEAVVKNSSSDWTIIRPPRLTNGPYTGRYQIATNQHLARGFQISRADVADYIVMHLTNPDSYRALVEIAA